LRRLSTFGHNFSSFFGGKAGIFNEEGDEGDSRDSTFFLVIPNQAVVFKVETGVCDVLKDVLRKFDDVIFEFVKFRFF
jgi:hypothetical protein